MLSERACSPSRYDPNLALNIEICETINKKQGNAPRTAAQTIVRLVNSTKINQALLALTLLDNCVKNCGYPFHLQIASKDFLNALVRRFPERPPTRYAPNPVQSAPENQWNHFDFAPLQPCMANPVIDRILYLIKEWKIALAELARYKEDMTHIKDMYRLLKFKGYIFPELRETSIAALTPADTLKSAQELEEEDRIAKAAKLQELIRRGTPQDLVEANQLMKIMTGYDQKHQVNFKEKFAEELHKTQNKARLLYEMLANIKTGDSIEEGGTIDELKIACESALPKIKSLLKESKEAERTEELTEVKSTIKGALLKYQDIKHGQYDTEYDVSGKFKSDLDKHMPPPAISLIDLEDGLLDSTSSSPSLPPQNELSELFGQPSDSVLKTVELFNKNGLGIHLDVYEMGRCWRMKAHYSNRSTAPMEKMTLLLAAPRSMQLKLEPVSSDLIPPKSERTVTQWIRLENPHEESLRLRYKITYEQFGVEMEQSGDYHTN
ncbi:putative ADP-ribosylation factor-binding protein C25H2.16c [Choanephora cucurbitarum]|uniref:Putative ADP-ribosylation factor-binding protein C25H2.16c n=2 Tax=Choanephora cucurbitarum TaxID=101091 RepID=A0A1C7NIP3_9FUNG|nr:putative ADP-ribosylation factor-binding protein C25H2.16c [Choanephora cucurbitarum]